MYGRPNHSDPSQPEWRLPTPARPAVGQADPPLPPPPPRPGASYSPATYGPISGSSVNTNVSPVSPPSADPRTWGVRYNQHHIYAPPPLPPRPSSTNEQPFAYAQPQPQLQSPAINPTVSPPPQGYGFEAVTDTQPPANSSTHPPYIPPTAPAASSPVPPPPPKIPQGSHNVPAQQGSDPTRPPLLAQGAGPAATQGSYGATPNPNAASTGPSALGAGTPSDWEYLGPTPGDFDDAPWFPDRQPAPQPQTQAQPQVPTQPQAQVQTPPGFSTGIPNPPVTSTAPPTRPRVDTNQPFSSIPSRPEYSRRNDSISPISPVTTLAGQVSYIPSRADSVSSHGTFQAHAESIDNVIDAWVRPLSPARKPSPPIREGSVSQTSSTSQSNRGTPVAAAPVQSSASPAQNAVTGASPAAPTPQTQGGTPAPKNSDPYEDLDPWFKSSLTRFVAMLRKEAVADSDEERFKIFTAFMSKETKLREILYNIEHEAQSTQPAPRLSVPTTQRSSSSSEERKSTVESGLIPVESEELLSPAATTEDGNDIDDTASEYSSGGRPTLAKKARRGPQWQPKLSSVPSSVPPGEDSTNHPPKAPTRQSTMDEDTQKHVLEPLTTSPPRPIYTPFHYTEGPQRGSDNLTFDRPAYQAYSDLRQASGSGRVMSNAPQPTLRSRSATLSSPAHDEHNETFIGLIRDRSSAYQAINRRNTAPLAPLPESLRRGRSSNLVDELHAMVWTPLDKQSESSWHITAREGVEQFSDDFSYIQEAIDQWENAAKPRRQKLEQERTARQEESEAQIDDLFNEKEIGYADINTLEEDFRQSEARVQLDEERQEVDDYIGKVFNPLDKRLKDEISALRKSYDSTLNQLDRDQKGKSSPVEQCSPSVTMRMVNEIHNKLEIRFQKRLELALDCERRRKKAERRPLVFMGDMATLRRLDGDFDRMEKRNILEAAKDRDDRANRLMDCFDDAILHGLGMNQSLLDELATKAAQLDPTSLRASGLPDSEIEQILKSAATFSASLRADSEAILRCSGVADMVLNDADYNVSVAEARYADSEEEVFQRLEVEKKKEDKILQDDLESKLQSIQKSPKEIEDTIQRLLRELRETPASAPVPSRADDLSPSSQPVEVPPLIIRPATGSPSQMQVLDDAVEDPEVEHKERLRKALEDAKKRNAARVNQ